MKILIVSPYPRDTAPSQRFRYEQYLDLLKEAGYTVEFSPFWDSRAWAILYKPGRILAKFAAMFRGILRRLGLLFTASRYDLIFIHREFSPVGYPWVAYVVSRWLKIPIVFDFDDAVWIPNSSKSNAWTEVFRSFSSTSRLVSWASAVSCGNEYLRGFALTYNANAFLNPTTIDTANYHNRLANPEPEPFVIGWTGSHSTVSYLNELVPVIEKLSAKHSIELRVISDRPPEFTLSCLRFVPWEKESEIDDLLTFHVGVMPLRTDPWSEGKCGFKALQYMALGIPALVSPVGVNVHIVSHGTDGFICHTEQDWEHYLEALIVDRTRLAALKTETRKKIETRFSVQSNSENFLHILALARSLPRREN